MGRNSFELSSIVIVCDKELLSTLVDFNQVMFHFFNKNKNYLLLIFSIFVPARACKKPIDQNYSDREIGCIKRGTHTSLGEVLS